MLLSKNAPLQDSLLVSLMESQKTLDAEIFDIKSGGTLVGSRAQS